MNMIINYIKIALRNLLKNKLFTFINITGLTIGLVSFVLIMLYVNYERSFDRFFPNADRVNRVYMDYLIGGKYEAGDAQTYNLSGPTLKEKFPEIKEFVRIYALDKTTFVYNNNACQVEHGHLVDSSYFTVFGIPLIMGDNQVLDHPNTIVLTKELAHRIFENDNPLGKTIRLYESGEDVTVTVTGVMDNIPENTHMRTNFLISFSTGNKWNVGRWDLNWDNNNFFTYILLNRGVNAQQFKHKIMAFDDNVDNERHNTEPLSSIHLHSHKPYEVAENGSASRVQFLLAIAIVIMVLSWLNYVNLSISKSMERALETGVRKASGASRQQLLMQFLVESSLINGIAIALAIVLTLMFIPIFNEFTGKDLALGILNNRFYLALFGFIAIGSFGSGLFPALALAKTNPSLILKGKNRRKTLNTSAQKILVVSQIVATIVLVVATIAINKQIRYIQNLSMGFNNQQVISLTGDVFSNADGTDYKVLKTELDKLPCVNATAFSQSYPGDGFINMSTAIGLTFPDGYFDNRATVYYFSINEDYIPLMNIELLAGRNYELHDNQKNVVVINEEMSTRMGFLNPQEIIGKSFELWGRYNEVIGVVKNHNHFGVKSSEQMMLYRYDNYSNGNLLVKLNEIDYKSTHKALKQIEQVWNKVFKQSLFQYVFIDEKFNQQFNEDKKFNKAFGLFTVLAIIIASLGLFGLGTQICTHRTKEIGVRKVNGAKVFEVITMLNKEFVQWVILAFIIALPISFLTVHKWLEAFNDKTTLDWWVFALGGFISLSIAILTVSWQSWRAASRNPVESLRYE